MKKVFKWYLIIAAVATLFHIVTLGTPGILTAFAMGDFGGKGGTNLPSGAAVLTGPIDFLTSPVQLPFLLIPGVKRFQETQQFKADQRFVERASRDTELLTSLILESSERKLTEAEKQAISKGRDRIQTEQLYKVFEIFSGNGSAIAGLMDRDDINRDHLAFLHQQELDRYEREGLHRYNMYSRVWDELSTHPKTPRGVLEELRELNDEPTRRKARKRLAAMPKSEQDGADQPATAPESKPEGDSKPKPETEGRSQ